jgi:hypothetical protein
LHHGGSINGIETLNLVNEQLTPPSQPSLQMMPEFLPTIISPAQANTENKCECTAKFLHVPIGDESLAAMKLRLMAN